MTTPSPLLVVPKGNERQLATLPRHCSSSRISTDTILFESERVTVGQFRCDVDHPRFRDTGPIRQATVVFPRTSVWIQHEGSRRFVADPNVITIYNRGQSYQRFAISPDGDRCDWFALSDALALEIADAVTPSLRLQPERPFSFERARSSHRLHVKQRRLRRRAATGELTSLEAEEEVLAIVAAALALANTHDASRSQSPARSARRHRDLAEAARAEIARTALDNVPVTQLALALNTSAFHLCRVFREQTGETMHGYRVRLRLRHAIELLDGANAPTLSAIAHDAGFASHAHFVRICRRELGITPALLRSQMQSARV